MSIYMKSGLKQEQLVKLLTRLENGLNFFINESMKFSDDHILNMDRFDSCAVGTFTPLDGFSSSIKNYFGFYPEVTKISISESDHLTDVEKQVNMLFASDGISGKSFITVKEWRNAAIEVLNSVKSYRS